MWFNWVDLLIVFLLIGAATRGATNGLLRQVFSLLGFIGGLIAGAALAPYASRLVTNAGTRQLIIIAVVFAGAALVGGLGEYIGQKLALTVAKVKGGPIDYTLGAVFGIISALIAIWLVAGVLVATPFQELNKGLIGSKIVRELDTYLPAAPPIVARLERLVDPNGFPRVFSGLEPAPQGPVSTASAAEVQSAVAVSRASTVKIQGVGCGGLITGSGFVAAPGLVITNAHVVAGIRAPVILDDNGRHAATTIVFDQDLDIAVLRASELAGEPLKLSTKEYPANTHTIVLGYPGGGDFTAGAGGIIDERLATGRNIYDAGLTDREIYELQTLVQPGNSGGPLVLPNGTVIGVVFARSQTNNNLGYALTMTEVQSRLDQAKQRSNEVNTGACAAG
jgi:S1-C subfamily serine protease